MQFGGDGEDGGGGGGGLGEAWTLRRSYTLREKAGVRQTDPKCASNSFIEENYLETNSVVN